MLLYRSFFTLVFLSSFLYQITTPSLYSPFQQHNQCIPHLTACQEFAHLHRTPTLFSLVSSRSRRLRTRNPYLCVFFLLCGDVEPNPGPTNFTLCTLNIRSILQPLHSAALCDLIDSHHPDLFCLTKTWIKPTTTFTELKHCTLPKLVAMSPEFWISAGWQLSTIRTLRRS